MTPLDRDSIAFVVGLPVGALPVLVIGLIPELRRVLVVACLVLFVAGCWLAGMERCIEVLGNGVERFSALRGFNCGVAAGAVITILSLPRPSRPSGSSKP